MRPYGAIHLCSLIVISGIAVLLAWRCSRGLLNARVWRWGLAAGLAANEIIRYLHDGVRFPNDLPLHLCTLSTWVAVAACLTLNPLAVEWVYFEGLAGAGMALLNPDLPRRVQEHFPSYEAIRYLIEHGGIIVVAAILVFGRLAPLRPGALLRGNLMFVAAGLSLLLFNQLFGTNYLYLSHKPASHTLLDVMGPWPVYLATGEIFAMAIFWLLWLAARPQQPVMEECERSA